MAFGPLGPGSWDPVASGQGPPCLSIHQPTHRRYPENQQDGSKKDEVDLDTERFFRAADRTILEHDSRPSGLPLILAALTEHHERFRRVSQNPFLVDGGLHVDPASLTRAELCDRAWRAIEPQYLARLLRLIDAYGASRAKGSGTDDPEQASDGIKGRISTLLIDADRVLPGRIDLGTGRVRYVDPGHPEVDDVLDELAELVRMPKGADVVVPTDECRPKPAAFIASEMDDVLRQSPASRSAPRS